MEDGTTIGRNERRAHLEAKAYLKRAYQIYVAALGHSAVATRESTGKYSQLLDRLGQATEAEALRREAQAARQENVLSMEWRRAVMRFARETDAEEWVNVAPPSEMDVSDTPTKDSHPHEHAIFAQLDTDGDGSLQMSDIETDLEHMGEKAVAARLLAYLDTDNDGKVCFPEFVAGFGRWLQ